MLSTTSLSREQIERAMKWAPWIAALTLVGLAITMVIAFVNRLSDREVALIVGAVCGAGVATPLGLALGMALATQRMHDREVRLPPAPPPVIYVTPQPPASQTTRPSYPAGLVNSPALPRRSYNVIGGDAVEDDGVEH